jgi:two-component system sensor histidine kinase KdpD
MVTRVRDTFSLDGATLLAQREGEWVVIANAGTPCASPTEADTQVKAGDGLYLALTGRPLLAEDQRLIGAFADQLALVHEGQRLAAAAAAAAPLENANKMRTALLAAVGHDLRTPLAAAKASVSGLRSRDAALSEADRSELVIAADESLDRLAHLVDNLLDMSRLQAGALDIVTRPTAIDEAIAQTLDQVDTGGHNVLIDIPDDLPLVAADPGLLERVIANLVANAVRYSPDGVPVLVTCSQLADTVEIRVVDRGTGIPPEDHDRVFLPFQRLGDTDNSTGVGLGLALARGLTEVMGGTLELAETPGGGLTMVISLRALESEEGPTPGLRERSAELS